MIYLVIVSLIWAFSFGLIKGELSGLSPMFSACIRLALALPLFLPFLKLSKISKSDFCYLVLIGAVQYGLMYVFYFLSFAALESFQVALYTITTPIFVTLLYDFRSGKLRKANLSLAILASIGAGVIAFKSNQGQIIGFLLVQGSNLCFAWGQVSYKRFRERSQSIKDHEIYALLYLGALITTAVATTIDGGWSSMFAATPRQWLVLIYLGVVASALGFFWWNKGAVLAKPGTLAIFNDVKIPLAVLVSLTIFQESADTTRLILGGGIMLCALVAAEYVAKKRVKDS